MSFVQELKRRNVFRVGVAYMIIAWLLLQVSDTLVPALHLPEWFQSGVALLLILGFPLALFFAWAFELTPDGLKKEKDSERSESITAVTGRKLDFVIIALLVVALGYFAYDKFVLDPDRDEVATTDVLKSIAVLPFVAMSSAKDDGYFADGLTEEILNSLAQISDLKVAGRTSSFYYKGKDQDMRLIGAELGVGNILEGSVRRAGNQLRITAQLIKADDGFHLWSGAYNRSIDDIFAIQEDIANKVTAALQVTLLGAEAEALSQHGTANAAAQTNYLIATAYLRRGRTLWVDATQKNEHLKAARRLLEEAVELDPDFAQAWAMLVPAYYLVAGSGLPDGSGEMPTFAEANALAEVAARRAIALAPDLPEAWIAMGLQMSGNYDSRIALVPEVEAAYEKALQLDPDNLTALDAYARYRQSRGQYAAEIALYDRMLALDPISTVRLLRAQAMYRNGSINEARREYFEVARLYADAPYQGGIAEIEFDRGHFHHGIVWLSGLAGSLQPPYAWSSLGDTERGLEAWSVYAGIGGAVGRFTEMGEYFFRRDYQGLGAAATAATYFQEFQDIQFLLPSFYYLESWSKAVSLIESWPAEHPVADFPDNITGEGIADERHFQPDILGMISTNAAYYAHALAQVGRREDAEPVWRWALTLAERLPKATPRDIQERHHIRLLVFASRGEKDAALSELEAMVDAGWRWLMSPANMDSIVYRVGRGWFEDSPLMDSIRGEPRFIAAVNKVKADNAAMLAELNGGLTLQDIIDEDMN